MTDIDLGFAETCEAEWLTNRYFPSKLGGAPAWLELEYLPTKEQLICAKCKEPKTFLCQIYASFDDVHNFHRTLYVFVCRSENCQQPNKACNITVLRSQLPRENAYYSAEPPAEEGTAMPAIPAKRKLCLACGCPAPLACSRCKKANYCSALHQRAHWPQHKKICGLEEDAAKDVNAKFCPLPAVVFPEWEIVIEPNADSTDSTEDAEGEDDEAAEGRRLAEFERLAAEGKAGELQDVPVSELDKYVHNSAEVDDKQFRKFKREVAKEPEQVLRYKRGGAPLWIAPIAETVQAQVENVPNCSHCGSARQFEFQIMPQMLLKLKQESLDWGVLAIYTCSKSCAPPTGMGYVEEYGVKQDIVK